MLIAFFLDVNRPWIEEIYAPRGVNEEVMVCVCARVEMACPSNEISFVVKNILRR